MSVSCSDPLLQFMDLNYLYFRRCGVVEKTPYGDINSDLYTKADNAWLVDTDEVLPDIGFLVWIGYGNRIVILCTAYIRMKI